ncbi:MAG: CBS domain-containing protein [Acidobacteria bacterium]|nr:CBS domain-containing protein [Acidobacteriota bacterium]
MTREATCIVMDTSIGDCMEVCEDKRIRHLPVVDDQDQLVGLVTDRDLRYFVSPRTGTISENNSDRLRLKRPVHLIMAREVVSTSPETSLSDAAELMLTHKIGCLPVIDPQRHVVGIVTTSDFIRYIAQG